MSDLANTPVAALLELAASQLEVAAHSTNAQMETLAGSIGALVLLGAELKAASAGAAREALAQEIIERAQTAVVAMQFHDQLVQRVAHVRDALTELNEALQGTPANVDWATVLAGIRFRYSMEDERRLFDRIIGATACPDVNCHDSTHDSLRGGVEIF
jgi:hypothetical protein